MNMTHLDNDIHRVTVNEAQEGKHREEDYGRPG
jgi:hypothetical protein